MKRPAYKFGNMKLTLSFLVLLTLGCASGEEKRLGIERDSLKAEYTRLLNHKEMIIEEHGLAIDARDQLISSLKYEIELQEKLIRQLKEANKRGISVD